MLDFCGTVDHDAAMLVDRQTVRADQNARGPCSRASA